MRLFFTYKTLKKMLVPIVSAAPYYKPYPLCRGFIVLFKTSISMKFYKFLLYQGYAVTPPDFTIDSNKTFIWHLQNFSTCIQIHHQRHNFSELLGFWTCPSSRIVNTRKQMFRKLDVSILI
jgi:hypothetical protein